MSFVVDEHRQYLADRERVSAFRQAIGEVVKAGDVVLDLGAGTGILGLLACRAGAGRVYSIDEGGMIELAREIARANGLDDRITFIKGLSTRVNLPEPVDVIVADQIGRFGFEAGLLDYFTDARKRFLKPGGATIPSRVDMCVAPVELPELWNQVEFWNNSEVGFNLRPARVIAANTGYPVKLSSEQLLGDCATAASLDLSVETHETLNLEASIAVKRNGNLHGIGGWFSAQLSDNVTMSNSPLDTRRINRMNVFFPIDRPVALTQEDLVRIKMRILPGEMMVQWIVEVCGNNENLQGQKTITTKAKFSHSTLKGMLISNEDLRKTQPDFIPKLSPWGEARRSVVNLCDGRRTLVEIEDEIYRSHSQLFPSLAKAAEFVAEVVTRYAL